MCNPSKKTIKKIERMLESREVQKDSSKLYYSKLYK